MLSLNTKHKRVIDEHVLFIKSCGFNMSVKENYMKNMIMSITKKEFVNSDKQLLYLLWWWVKMMKRVLLFVPMYRFYEIKCHLA